MDQKIALPNSRALLREAWDVYKKNHTAILTIQIFPLVFLVLGILLVVTSPVLSAFLSFVGSILTAFAVLTLLTFVGRYSSAGVAVPSVRDLYRSSLGLILPFIWLGLLNGLVMLGGAILFIVPALILVILLCCYSFVFVLEGQRGLRALATSWVYVSGSWWRVFWRQIVLFVTVILAYMLISAVAGLGGKVFSEVVSQLFIVLILTPLSAIYGFVLYGYLKNGVRSKMDEAAFETKVVHYRKWLKVFAILGLAPIAMVVLVGITGAAFLGAFLANLIKNGSSIPTVLPQ